MKSKEITSIVFLKKPAIYTSMVLCLAILCSCAAPEKESRDTFTVQSDSLRRTAQGTIEAQGNVSIETKDFILYAPGFVYTPTNARVVFEGPVAKAFMSGLS